MIDKEVIEKKIDIITENMEYLHETKKIDIDKFTSSFEKIQATKHCLQEAIEACLDIANHIIASKGFPRAEEYGQFFSILADKKIIRKGLANRLADMAKFRNLLVHRYSVIEPKELHRILNDNLADIEAYVKEIMNFTSKN
ncbi:MAG: DUF86 domain-containing protein [Candidatus Altiarchaeales archaeon]|nr:DUF86 domain-containing protein [Candidatus Altiarchaeota archaeon]MCG2782780.1 DUF86 domain-containing protein [Candidatus Altiarchaeales archaeon]MBU4266621.1 DUF86 domain-containing protein [Candidatus Altiarchaeota archaeon]MBU4341189.1 DUF86 domain-containing protein [Candidatus Altiarchaeota archaeon]MBU4406417.1 DUF86 domain-containing protein [Candidatus Altiarchaeota archaeon]